MHGSHSKLRLFSTIKTNRSSAMPSYLMESTLLKSALIPEGWINHMGTFYYLLNLNESNGVNSH